jgi:hypothetical protein
MRAKKQTSSLAVDNARSDLVLAIEIFRLIPGTREKKNDCWIREGGIVVPGIRNRDIFLFFALT